MCNASKIKMVSSNLGVTSESSTEQFSVIMITTGHLRLEGPGRHGHEECRTSEVINLEDENKSCDNLDQYELGVGVNTFTQRDIGSWMVPRGGVVNGKPLVCGGDSGLYLQEWHTSCSIWDKNTWRYLTNLNVMKSGFAGIIVNDSLWITGGYAGYSTLHSVRAHMFFYVFSLLVGLVITVEQL